MGIISRLFSPRPSEGEYRFRSSQGGSILDSIRNNSPILILNSNFYCSIANNMAKLIGPEALRTLRYAATDEWRRTLGESGFSWKGEDPDKWRGFRQFWRDEGHLEASIVLDKGMKKYALETNAPSSASAGNLAAAIEYALGHPIIAGVESQGKSSAFLSIRSFEGVQDPKPDAIRRRKNPSNPELRPLDIDGMSFKDGGGFRRFNQSFCVVPMRLFDYWEDASLHPKLTGSEHVDNNWERSLCEAISAAFVESGELILIENEESWGQVGERHLSRWGFGKLLDVRENKDEIVFTVYSDGRPSIVSGLLSGMIRRQKGKEITPIWKMEGANILVEFSLS